MGSRLLHLVLVGVCLVALLASGCSLGGDDSDGDEILFVRERATASKAIFLMSNDGREVRRLVAGDWPRWSPDGTRFAYSVNDEDGGASLWVMNPDTKEKRRIVSSHAIYGPAWAPDGVRLAYTDLTRVFVVNTETGDSKPVSLEILVGGPLDWSLDGRKLLVSSGASVKVLELDTGTEREAAPRRFVDHGNWSSDGERMAFSERNSRWNPRRKAFDLPADGRLKSAIVIADRDGGSRMQVTSGAFDTEPAWSDDGERIYFTREPSTRFDEEASASELYVIDLETRSLRPMTETPATERSPDPRPAHRSLPDPPEPATGEVVVPDLVNGHLRLADEKRRLRGLGLQLRAFWPPRRGWLYVVREQVPLAGSRVPLGMVVKLDGSDLVAVYHHFRERFSAPEWRKQRECGLISPRARMYLDLVDRVLRRGMPRERVFTLLGVPGRSDAGTAAWPVGRLSVVRVGCIYLRIDFDRRGRTTRFYQSLS